MSSFEKVKKTLENLRHLAIGGLFRVAQVSSKNYLLVLQLIRQALELYVNPGTGVQSLSSEFLKFVNNNLPMYMKFVNFMLLRMTQVETRSYRLDQMHELEVDVKRAKGPLFFAAVESEGFLLFRKQESTCLVLVNQFGHNNLYPLLPENLGIFLVPPSPFAGSPNHVNWHVMLHVLFALQPGLLDNLSVILNYPAFNLSLFGLFMMLSLSDRVNFKDKENLKRLARIRGTLEKLKVLPTFTQPILTGGAILNLDIVSYNSNDNFVTTLERLFCALTKPGQEFVFPDVICLQEINDDYVNFLNAFEHENVRHNSVPLELTFIISKNGIHSTTFQLSFEKFHVEKPRRSLRVAGVTVTEGETPVLPEIMYNAIFPTYVGIMAEQSAGYKNVASTFKNLCILVKYTPNITYNYNKEQYWTIQRSYSEERIKKLALGYYLSNTNVDIAFPKKSAAKNKFHFLYKVVKAFFSTKTNIKFSKELKLSLYNVNNFIQNFTQYLKNINEKSQTPESSFKVVPQNILRNRISLAHSVSELSFRKNLFVRGVLAVKLSFGGKDFYVATNHNLNLPQPNVKVYEAFLKNLVKTKIPFVLIGDTNISVNVKFHSFLTKMCNTTGTKLCRSHEVTSSSNLIDWSLSSKSNFNCNFLKSIPVVASDTINVNCNPSRTKNYVRKILDSNEEVIGYYNNDELEGAVETKGDEDVDELAARLASTPLQEGNVKKIRDHSIIRGIYQFNSETTPIAKPNELLFIPKETSTTLLSAKTSILNISARLNNFCSNICLTIGLFFYEQNEAYLNIGKLKVKEDNISNQLYADTSKCCDAFVTRLIRYKEAMEACSTLLKKISEVDKLIVKFVKLNLKVQEFKLRQPLKNKLKELLGIVTKALSLAEKASKPTSKTIPAYEKTLRNHLILLSNTFCLQLSQSQDTSKTIKSLKDFLKNQKTEPSPVKRQKASNFSDYFPKYREFESKIHLYTVNKIKSVKSEIGIKEDPLVEVEILLKNVWFIFNPIYYLFEPVIE